DREVHRFVDAAYKSAVDILSNNHDMMERMSKALLEREVLDANEIQAIVEGRELPAKPKSGSDEEVQKVMRPEPGRQPGMAPGPATA
ncbi:MAG TPA: hypothetical protein VKB56_11500, partial [Terriglobales bacterium]|nr:hypothetical protein [Terriglobales bacterium]